jgi:hypothetical protein
MKGKFLLTDDKATINALRLQGFEEISQVGKVVCFLNNETKFDALPADSKKNVVGSNMLMF